jgi:hypothetical protein
MYEDIQMEPKLKPVVAEVLEVESWFISAPPMKASKKSMMKHPMKLAFKDLGGACCFY